MASVIPSNSAAFSLEQVVTATGAQLVSGGASQVVGVSTDTRMVCEGGLFVALNGERFDGHRFVPEAVERGAAAVVVERAVALSGPKSAEVAVLRVPSTLQALGHLGRTHRRRWGGRLVAVAGSVGKTTTRSAVTAVFRAAGQVVHSPVGNLNNRVGVPMVLLGLEARHTVGVVELGTSLPGEVEILTNLAEPNVAVLTRISVEHSEGLGDLDAIEHEEGAILRGLDDAAWAVVNGDDARCVRQLSRRRSGPRVLYGRGLLPDFVGDWHIASCQLGAEGRTEVELRCTDGRQLKVNSPLLGEPGAYAVAAAVAAVEACLAREVTNEQLREAMRSQELGEPGRLCPIALADGSLLLDDSYNSSPASVLSTVAVAAQLARGRSARLVLLLGEMRELGVQSADLHREVGEQLADAGASVIIAFGGDARHFLAEGGIPGTIQGFEAEPLDAARRCLDDHRPGDVVVVKSSRGLRAERIVENIVSHLGRSS